MKRKRRREFQKEEAVRLAESGKQSEKSIEAGNWPGERLRYLWLAGIVLIAIGTAIIYGQTVRVPTIDYEDPFYLVYSPYVHVSSAFSRMDAVWTEPYFANFHPVTTTTWLVDRAFADKTQGFDALPFRITHLLYAILGASLLIWLYRRLGIPAILAVLGALIYAVHSFTGVRGPGRCISHASIQPRRRHDRLFGLATEEGSVRQCGEVLWVGVADRVGLRIVRCAASQPTCGRVRRPSGHGQSGTCSRRAGCAGAIDP
jgi:hypothetical protein